MKLAHTITLGLNRGRDYKETREYINEDHDIKICFKLVESSPVCIVDNSFHDRFITEVWSENFVQWISSKEKQFGKIGRVDTENTSPLSPLPFKTSSS